MPNSKPDPVAIDTAKLLRLKRYEQPPEGYFDDFMCDLHRRQRADLVRRPTREVLWDRIMSLAPTFHVPRLAYAAILAMAVTASIFIVGQQPEDQSSLASAPAKTQPASKVSLASTKPVTISDALPASTQVGGSLPSHYVLQARPVSNEQPLSF